MGKIRVMIEFDDSEYNTTGVGSLPKVPLTQNVVRYGAEFDGDTSEYDISDAVIETIEGHRDGKVKLTRLEDFK